MFLYKIMIRMYSGLMLNYLLVAPLTQAGLNPAHDLGMQMVTRAIGWGDIAFPNHLRGYFYVDIFAR